MEIEQGDIDKLLRFAAQVESNCEFLNYVKNITTERSRIHRDSIKTLDQYMSSYRPESKVKFNFEGLNQFIIELAYFLYSCKTFGKTPVIELEDIRVEESYIKTGQKRFTILLFYKIADQVMEEMQGFNVFNSIIEHIEAGLSNYIQNKKENGEPPSTSEAQFETAFQLFWHQFKEIVQSNFFAEKQALFFLGLEQTSLFYEYSMLYRIKNCSILDYIKTNPTRMETFKIFQNKDQTLLQQYNQEKKRSKSEPQTLRVKQKQIDSNLQTFFKKINENNTEIIQSKNQKDQACRVKFNFKILQKEKLSFQQVMASFQGGDNMREQGKPRDFKRPLAQLDYFIQYSSERNSICVRLFMPNIVVNVETSDFLMFQSNVLAFDAVNVSIELSQLRVKTGEKNPKKIVAFKGTSSFNVKQPPLEKILMLIDITMIASRIYEPELNSQKYGQNASRESYQKMSNIAKKVSHYTKLYMKCAKKVYEQ